MINDGSLYLLVLLLIFPVFGAHAGEVQTTSVEYSEGVYSLELDAIVLAEHASVYKIVTDDNNLYRLSNVLIESTLLSDINAQIKRRRLVTKTCILFFCFKTTLVEEVEEIDDTLIIATIDASQSDFEFGKTYWQITPEESGVTRIHYQSEIKPSFWIPPVIGPWVVKRKMLKEAMETIDQLELLAHDD